MICTSQESTIISTRIKKERRNPYIPNYVHTANINRKTFFCKEDKKKFTSSITKRKYFTPSCDSTSKSIKIHIHNKIQQEQQQIMRLEKIISQFK